MARRRNAVDGRPAARPKGVPQAARLGVTALGKGVAIPCAPCLDPNRLWDSACGFIDVAVSKRGMHALMPLPGITDARVMVHGADMEAAEQVLRDLNPD